IAAGEVVQRPSSVVKELGENAVDAGATQVTVILSDAGRTLIQVIDNGCGMTPDQAVLCFERHATSKIATADDLLDITTFGFRGEALASIAAVAEVTLKTRRAEDEVGCQVVYDDSKHVSTDEISTPAGSNFAVRNLFYNIPARRKFLKSDNVEMKHVVEEFVHVALTRSNIGFTLIHNGKNVYVLKPAKSLKFRIQDLLGSYVVSQVVDISADTSVVNVRGYVGRPDQAKKTLGNQYFFVNGRYFRSPYLHKAVMNAYENMLPQGATPAYFIYLEVDPHKLDVNISPTKTEVKFEDDSVIFQTLYACVKESLGRNSFGASIDFDTKDMAEIPAFSNDFDKFRPEVSMPDVSLDNEYNPFDNPDGGHEPSETGFGSPMPTGGNDRIPSGMTGSDDMQGWIPSGMTGGMPGGSLGAASGGDMPMPAGLQMPVHKTSVDFPMPDYTGASDPNFGMTEDIGSGANYYESAASKYVDKRDDYGKLFEDRMAAMPSLILIQKKYIATTVKSGMLLINIRRALERIMYERFLKALSGGEHVTQQALFPVQVPVGVENRLIFDEHSALLKSLGFDIAPFGNDTIVVNGMPEGFQVDQNSVEEAMAEVLIALSDNHTALPGMMESAMAEKFAKMAASEGKPIETVSAAKSLMDSLFACSNSEYTSNGRKIMTIMTIDDIEKRF
uniref:DNA mismatch repair endonuclease MutL n=1 Tax=Candidatus Cryptobacteroides bacterium TaxID=3085639 RepID=UPI004025601B